MGEDFIIRQYRQAFGVCAGQTKEMRPFQFQIFWVGPVQAVQYNEINRTGERIMIKTFMPMTDGKTDREKLDALVSFCHGLSGELNGVAGGGSSQTECLPVGTAVLRKNKADNAGMDYGTWRLLDETVQSSGGRLLIYIRTE